MNSMKLVIPLHSLYWSIHTKDESKCGTAFAFIFGVNWLWRCGVSPSFGVFVHEIKCDGISFTEFMAVACVLQLARGCLESWVFCKQPLKIGLNVRFMSMRKTDRQKGIFVYTKYFCTIKSYYILCECHYSQFPNLLIEF